MKTFTTLEELHKEWEVNGSCEEGKRFNHSCKTLEEVFEKCPMYLRLWRLQMGYVQFAEHCDWGKLYGYNWVTLLSYQPQFAKYRTL